DYWRDEPFLRMGLRGSRHRFIVDPDMRLGVRTDPETGRVLAGGDPMRASAQEHRLTTDETNSAPDRNDSGPEGWVEALGLIHRTGVVQVMLRVPLPSNLTTAQLNDRVSSYTATVTRSELPEPLLRPSAKGKELPGKWQAESVEG